MKYLITLLAMAITVNAGVFMDSVSSSSWVFSHSFIPIATLTTLKDGAPIDSLWINPEFSRAECDTSNGGAYVLTCKLVEEILKMRGGK